MQGAAEPTGADATASGNGRLPDEWRAVRLFLKEAVAALGAIGVVVYGVVRLAADSAYAQLLTTPEQVGVSQSELLGRAGLYVAMFVVFGVALSTVLTLGVYFLLRLIVFVNRAMHVHEPTRIRASTAAERTLLFGCALGTLVLAGPPIFFVLLMNTVADGLWDFLWDGAGSFLWIDYRFLAAFFAWAAIAGGTIFLIVRWYRRVRDTSAQTGWRLYAAEATALVGMLAVVGAAAFYLAIEYGRDIGSDVANGEPSKVGYQLLQVYAAPVCVEWVGGDETKPDILAKNPFLYLGQADGYTILTDASGPAGATQKGPARLPTSQLAMSPADGSSANGFACS